jgi:hypothetical protein
MLDEIGSIPEAFSEDFFRVLREVFTVREIVPCFRNLGFVLAGAFDPRDLIKDPRISPFNVAQRVSLKDFSDAQVRQLVNFLGVSGNTATVITERINHWTSGQPYLTQRMCALLAKGPLPPTGEGVEQAAGIIWREDTNHLARMFEELERDSTTRRYMERVLEDRAIRFAPAANRLQAKLAIIGIIKADEQGYCTVRNRICEEALKSYLEGEGIIETPSPEAVIDNLRVFISSTITNLGAERKAVKEAISELYLNPVFAEGFGARPGTPREECLAEVQESDLYIGLFWQRYGYLTDRGISATEEEYQEARASNKPILIYIKEPAPNREVALARFLRDVENYGTGHFRITFTTIDELKEQVKRDVMRAVSQLARERRQPPLTERGWEAQTSGVHIQAQEVHIHGDVAGRDAIKQGNQAGSK